MRLYRKKDFNKVKLESRKNVLAYMKKTGVKITDLDCYKYTSIYTGNFWAELENQNKKIA